MPGLGIVWSSDRKRTRNDVTRLGGRFEASETVAAYLSSDFRLVPAPAASSQKRKFGAFTHELLILDKRRFLSCECKLFYEKDLQALYFKYCQAIVAYFVLSRKGCVRVESGGDN
jgi:hypothetical protein